MKKIFINLIIFSIFLLISLILILSSIGIETNKFNKLISEKVSQTRNINLELETIKFKLDPKELSLFLETQNPRVNYRDLTIPVQSIKVYVDFLLLFKSDLKVKKINLILQELDITQLNQLSKIFKPSNFKSLLNNAILKGKLISEIEIFLNKDGKLKDFIAKGKVKDLKTKIIPGINLDNTNLSFFADKNDILIKSINGNIEDIKISDGDIKLNFENGLNLNSNFNSKLDLNNKQIGKYDKFFKNFDVAKNLRNISAELNNNLFIKFDKTYKIEDYDYSFLGNLNKVKFELVNTFKNRLINNEIKDIYLSNFQIKTKFTPNKIKLGGEGKYSFNDLDYLNINLENSFIKDLTNLKLKFDYKDELNLDLINYRKIENSLANIYIDLEKDRKNLKINKFTFTQGKNLINVNDLEFIEKKFSSFKNISFNLINNEFSIQKNKKILINGKKFDATNLFKFFNNENSDNIFERINSNIEINFSNIKVPMSEKLRNFTLIGEIKKGKFVKISSKGDFGGDNFLDISMKKDRSSNKKYLEIYSDLTRPLLTEYSFFNGLSGGKLLFNSIIENEKSNSKLKIENFKVVNAPGVIKLLSLADLGGLADLAEGEGLSFDILEIDMEKDKNFLKINEILALGPSVSVLMEGYQDANGLTSIRGTLVPAKTINKMISKIPVIGNIVIPKEAGEGLFGISFKMKGPKDQIKTTINPIRTLTPRFIQKIIDRNKNTK